MKKRILRIILVLALILVTVWLIWENQALVRTDYAVKSSNLPQAFDGYRIVQISDLHNTLFGKGNERLLEMIRSAQPDMIAITGDMIDSRHTRVDIALAFAKEAVKIAPCYYVTGNHELRVDIVDELLEGLQEAGVTVLRGEAVQLYKEDQWIHLVGIDDMSLVCKKPDTEDMVARQMLERFESKHYTVLLAHRGTVFDVFCDLGFDLTLTGHAHGGQIRLPWLGGLYGNGEFLPEYDAGLFQQGNTAMIVSRGLGNSLFPFRMNNRPEVVVITLEKGKEDTCEITDKALSAAFGQK